MAVMREAIQNDSRRDRLVQISVSQKTERSQRLGGMNLVPGSR